MILYVVDLEQDFEKNLKFLGLTLVIAIALIGVNNLMTPSSYPNVGFTQIDSECAGLDLGICLGIERQTHEVSNYDDWESYEPGTEDHRKLVESELMLRAYDACSPENVSGMDWTEEVEYENNSVEEWRNEYEDLTLLSCKDTFHFSVDD